MKVGVVTQPCAGIKTTNLHSNPFLFPTLNNSWKCTPLLPCGTSSGGLSFFILLASQAGAAHRLTNILTNQRPFSFEHAQLISQKAYFCPPQFGKKNKIFGKSWSENNTRSSSQGPHPSSRWECPLTAPRLMNWTHMKAKIEAAESSLLWIYGQDTH